MENYLIDTMRVGVDIRCLNEKRGGVSEYTEELLLAILEQDQENEYILFTSGYKRNPDLEKTFGKYRNVKFYHWRMPNKLANFLLRFLKWPKLDLKIGGVDVWWSPNWNFIALSDKVKFILTIHDLAWQLFPQTFSWKMRLWHWSLNLSKLLNRADTLIAVSENTKMDLVSYYKLPEDRVKVIYSGINLKYQKITDNAVLDKVKEKYSLPNKFILYLGTIEPRKNVDSLIEAFQLLQSKGKLLDCSLVIAGRLGWKTKNIQYSILNIKNVKYIGYVDQQDKSSLYSLADLFVYPSLYEGFGFPPLEALACGTKVVISHTPALMEIVGEWGASVNPHLVSDIALGIEQARNYAESNAETRGIIREKFDWGKTASEFLKYIEIR